MGLFDILESQKGLDPQSWDYNIDIVMCIDGTGSMDPILDEVKRAALSFGQIFKEAMVTSGKAVNKLRVKVVVFRDYIIDSVPMQESKFFTLPEDNREFSNFLDKIEACGGGDEPENALEAIATALASDWTKEGAKRRHVVLLFTDATALPLKARKDCPNYPSSMPANLGELSEWWAGKSQYFYSNYESKSGRLVIFAPKKEPWTAMETWNRTWINYSQESGLKGTKMEEIVNLLVGSTT